MERNLLEWLAREYGRAVGRNFDRFQHSSGTEAQREKIIAMLDKAGT